jgi:putrescine aminotransferase
MKSYSASEIEALKQADLNYYLHPTSSTVNLEANGPKIITGGKGCMVTDIHGKEYIDATASLWYCSIGHGRAEVADVAYEQITTLESFHSFNEFSNVPAITLAEKVSGMVPLKNARLFFTSGGSESNDTIFKLARLYWYCKGKDSKDIIITRNKTYSGVSCGALCSTRLPKFHEGFEPLLPGFEQIDTPHCYHCPWGREYPDCDLECAGALEEKIKELGADQVAAFIAEPVMGTGGVIIPPPGYYQKIRAICDTHEVLFIDDEVINAFGRTGLMFGIDHWDGVRPDFMTIAKAISSGYVQLGAVALSDEIFQTLKTLDKIMHGYTYSGDPLACAVGLKNLEIIERENLTANSKAMGQRLLQGFLDLDQEMIGEVRGKGLMVGVELVKDRKTKEKFETPLAPKVVDIAYAKGLITRPLVNDVLQFSPPLSISESEVDEIVRIVHESINEAQ